MNKINLEKPNQELIGGKLNFILSKLMEDNSISLSMLYRNTGIAIPTIKRLQSDPTTNPTITTLIPIANFFGITVTQLIGEEPLPTRVIGYNPNNFNWGKIPLIEWSQIIEWVNFGKLEQTKQEIIVDVDVEKKGYALEVEEDDWQSITKKSILVINPSLIPEHKDYAIVHRRKQINPTLKQVLIDEGNIYLQHMNPIFKPTAFDKDHQFLGVLMQIKKNVKG